MEGEPPKMEVIDGIEIWYDIPPCPPDVDLTGKESIWAGGQGLRHSCYRGDYAATQALLYDGSDGVRECAYGCPVDVNAVDPKTGDTALHVAMKTGAKAETCIKALLEDKRLDMTIKNNKGETAMDLAKSVGVPRMVKLLEGAQYTYRELSLPEGKTEDDLRKELNKAYSTN
jgi:hypothetical protein